ncbi:hypothetical protein LTR60_005882 [Cryomyces antarcticus]|nr:hypothetical protein LTR60_005882 [Cryomyces antarcticus]
MAARSANARKKGTKTSARKEDVKMEITKTVTVTTTSEPASNFGVADRIYARSTSVWSPSQGIPVTSDDVAGHEFAGLSPAIFSPPTLNTKSSSITSAARLSSSSDETTMGSSASATRARQTWKNVTKSSHVPTITRAEMLTNGHRLVEIKPGENEKPVFVLLKRGKKGPQTCHLKDTDGKARGEITLDDADFEDYPVGMEQNHSVS